MLNCTVGRKPWARKFVIERDTSVCQRPKLDHANILCKLSRSCSRERMRERERERERESRRRRRRAASSRRKLEEPITIMQIAFRIYNRMLINSSLAARRLIRLGEHSFGRRWYSNEIDEWWIGTRFLEHANWRFIVPACLSSPSRGRPSRSCFVVSAIGEFRERDHALLSRNFTSSRSFWNISPGMEFNS